MHVNVNDNRQFTPRNFLQHVYYGVCTSATQKLCLVFFQFFLLHSCAPHYAKYLAKSARLKLRLGYYTRRVTEIVWQNANNIHTTKPTTTILST